MLLNLDDEALLPLAGYLHCVVDLRELFGRELHVHYRPHHLHDFADGSFSHYILPLFLDGETRFLTVCAGRSLLFESPEIHKLWYQPKNLVSIL